MNREIVNNRAGGDETIDGEDAENYQKTPPLVLIQGTGPDRERDIILTPNGLRVPYSRVLQYGMARTRGLFLINTEEYRVYALEDLLEWHEYKKQFETVRAKETDAE